MGALYWGVPERCLSKGRLDLARFSQHLGNMSARTLLMEEIARAPESVAREVLGYLRGLMLNGKPPSSDQDYFESYWKDLYGSMEGAEWNEPSELPVEEREGW